MFSKRIVSKRTRLMMGVASMSLLLAGTALAGSVSTSLGVSGSVTDDCTIAAAPSIAFDNYHPATSNLTSPLNSTGTLSVTCTTGTVAEIDLSTGANGGVAVGTTRAMKSGANLLNYELYSDSSRSVVWGVGAGTGGVTELAAPSATAVNYIVYGQVPGGQNIPAATDYADSVAVTVNF
jgi:spore coat protein U-like protein